MRLITYVKDAEQEVGAWINNDRQVLRLAAASALGGKSDPALASMLSLIEAGPDAWRRAQQLVAKPDARALIPTAQVRLLAPLPRPAQLRDCLAFPEHLVGASRAAQQTEFKVPASYFDFPVYYISNRMAVTGPDDDVHWPPFSQRIDYEMEWAAVIGAECRGVTTQDARSRIFGYTIFNDWSARDEQFKVMNASVINLGPGGGKDFCNSLGPCIVTADEFADPYSLFMRVRVNGIQVSEGSTAGMHYKFEDLLAYLSRGLTLYPGEVIGSGTVGGGCAFETGQTLHHGDVIELEVENIGVLRNRVLAPHIEARS